MNQLIDNIKKDPYGRRKVVSLWQETDLRETPGLAPCAFLTIWNVRGDYLDMVLVQRSGDMLTASGAGGINEIQYAALLMMIARVTGKEPGVFTHFVANEQIYDRHMENADEMLRRAAELEASEEGKTVPAPALILNKEPGCKFQDITLEDFEMLNYEPLKPQLRFELGI
jgi:thymidylate synthase